MREVAMLGCVVLVAVALAGCESLLEPQTTVVRGGGGPTIGEAQAMHYAGPRARVAVIAFDNKTGKGHQIGEGMADMLATELFSTNRFIVLERRELGAVTAEQDLARSGRVMPGTGAATGQIEGAELLVMGAITVFEPNYQGGGLGAIRIHGRHPAALGLGVGQAYIEIDMRVVDSRTSRLVAATTVAGKSTDVAGTIGGIIGGGSSRFGVGLGAYRNTPMEKAVRACLSQAVQFVVSRTPQNYYHYDEMGRPIGVAAPAPGAYPAQPAPAQPTPAPQPGAQPAQPAPAQPGTASKLPAQVYVAVGSARAFQRPDITSVAVGTLSRGAALRVQAEEGDWYAVQLPDGKLAWIMKILTSPTPPQ